MPQLIHAAAHGEAPLSSAKELKEQQEILEAEAFYRNRPHDSFAQGGDQVLGKSQMNEPDIFVDLLSNIQPFIWPALLAVSGFIVRAIVTKKKTSFVDFLLDILAAMIIGSLVGVAIEDMELSQNIRYAMIAISGMVGPDLAGGIIILGQAFKESPTDFIIKHYNAFKGNKTEEKKGEKAMTYEEWNQANKDFIDKTFSSPTDGKHSDI